MFKRNFFWNRIALRKENCKHVLGQLLLQEKKQTDSGSAIFCDDIQVCCLTLTLLVANLVNTNDEKFLQYTRNPGKWYSTESTQRELSNEYQQDRVSMVFKNICVLLLWTKVASALGGLNGFLGSAIFPKSRVQSLKITNRLLGKYLPM